MPALRSCDDQQLTTAPPSAYNSKPQAHDIDEHALAAMSMYDHSQGAILSPTPRALSFPNHPMLDITLDGPTPRAFAFPAAVRDARGPPLTPPEPSPSTPSTSSSPFEPEQRPQTLYPQFSQQPQFTAPPIARRSQSVQRVRTATASPAAQLSSFNAPDPAPGAPLTLAARRRGSSISSLALPSHPASQTHTLSLTQSMSQAQPQPQPQPHNPHAHAIQLAGTERRPKRGDEDYIKRPENAFILFRRECCLKKNEAEAAAANEGDPIARRQRQADLSKTISQQWRSLSAEERKYWDDLAKQRKKEHEEMYPWYVYQPTRATKEKKGKTESAAGGKVRREKDGKSHRRDRTKSSSRVRGSRARNSSSCSTASSSSMMSASSSASTVDSEDFSELDSMSGDGSLYGAYGYANGGCSSVREVEMADYADFDMSESEGSQGQGQTLSLPLSLSMPSLGGASGSGAGSMSIDTRNALASFSLESGPITTSYSHSHHGHSHSAQISSQAAQNLMPGPLSFVLPQSRRSTSAPGAPTTPPMPADLYPSAPSAIKIPQLLETNSGSNESSAVGSPASREGGEEEQRAEYGGMNGFQFPNSHSQPMGYSMQGQVPNFTAAGGNMHQNSMFQIYDQQVPRTAKPRQRALSQLAIPSEPSTSTGGPLSAPPPPSSTSSSSSHHLYLPGSFSPSVQSPGGLQVPGQRTVPQGLPQSPEPPAAENEWDDYGLPAWAMPALCDPEENAASTQAQSQNQEQMQQSAFGEIEIGMDMGLPPWLSFGMGSMGNGIDGMGMDGERMDPYSINFQFEDLLDPSQL